MNIAYLSIDNPHDIHGWSGLTYNIAQSLVNAGNHLEYIHSFSAERGLIIKIKQKLYPKLTGKFIHPNRHKQFYSQYSRQILPQLQKLKNIDFIFSNSSEPIAALETDIPMAYWADACFAGMLGYYPEFDSVHPESVREANLLEQKALDRARYVFFASDWAAGTAIKNYEVDLRKVKVVPFGANVSHTNTLSDIQVFANNKSNEVCKLLFIGVYWERKGGDLALKITEILNRSGIKTELIIVGSKPFEEVNKPDYVIQEGFLSKNDPSQKQRLDQLFKESHFLVVPSRAECYGLVYCEANSYGLPAIGTKTGGIPTIIKDKVNGFTFYLDDNADAYVKCISNYFNDRKLYNDLSVSSFHEYESRLNWKVAGRTVSEFLSS